MKLQHNHFKNSILFTSLFTIVGILLALSIFTYTLTIKSLKDNTIFHTSQMIRQVDNGINYYIDSMVEVSDYIIQDKELQQYLSHPSPELKKSISTKFQTIAGTRNDFVNLILFSPSQPPLSNHAEFSINPYSDWQNQSWYLQALKNPNLPQLSSSRVENLRLGEYNWVVSMSRSIYKGDLFLGVLLIDLNYQPIADLCILQSSHESYVFILGEDKKLVYHPQQRLIYSGIKQEPVESIFSNLKQPTFIHNNAIYTTSKSPTTGWIIVSVYNLNAVKTFSQSIIFWYILVGLLFACIAFIISYKVAKKLTDPVTQLKQSMKRFEQGEWDVKANIKVHNEIGELAESFDSMTIQIKTLVEQERIIEEKKRQSQLQALQSQIRPHFLYNTLESIIWMAEIGENEKVVQMTASLSKLFRASVSDAQELIPLTKEIEYTQNYMTIQQMRYDNQFSLQTEIDPLLLNAHVLRLIIQPIVENAIYHGLKPLKTQGTICIHTYSEDNNLVIDVYDNGIGFSPNTAQFFVSHPSEPEEGGIGLSNVYSRLQLFFGQDYTITISSNSIEFSPAYKNMSTRVRLKLPLIYPQA